MTRECAVEGFRECAFARPELDELTEEATYRPDSSLTVSLIAPVGSRYYWRVRACSASDVCSDWTMVRYVNVGRDIHDFNGDGYADVVVGDQRRSNPEYREGGVFVYLGGPTGASSTADIVIGNPDNRREQQFGDSIGSAGDVNADGYGDLIIGSTYRHPSEFGQAYLFLGGPSGPDVTTVRSFETPEQFGSGFGHSVGGGDLDGDGYADVAIGCPACSFVGEQEGAVYLFRGSADGPNISPSSVLTNPLNQEYADFGIAVSDPDDISGDGFVDLVISAPAQSHPMGGPGSVYVYDGGLSGISARPDLTIDNPEEGNTYFGLALSMAGDTDGDGYGDLIVGAPWDRGSGPSGGSAYFFRGSRTGTTVEPAFTLNNPRNEANGFFGLSVAGIGDPNGDGLAAVMCGATGQTATEIREGEAYVFNGAGDPLWVAQNPENTAEGGFGARVVGVGDINGDGYTDALVAAPGNDQAEVHVYYGAPSGLSRAAGSVLRGDRFSFGVGAY